MQSLSQHICQPEQNHSVIKQEMLIATRLMSHATWLQLQNEQAVLVWLLCHPRALPSAWFPRAGATHHASPWQTHPGFPGLCAGECTPGSRGPAEMFRGKAMHGRPKLLLACLWLMKAKEVVSKISPFSEILLSDFVNSPGNGWAVTHLWTSQAVLSNVFNWDITKYYSQ